LNNNSKVNFIIGEALCSDSW